MDKLETEILETAERIPDSYGHAMWTTVTVFSGMDAWICTSTRVPRPLQQPTPKHSVLTWDCRAGGDPVNYMDLKISINSNNKLPHTLFQKPSDSGVSLNFESCVLPSGRRRIVWKTPNLSVTVLYGQAPNLKQKLARLALLPSGCTIQDKFERNNSNLKEDLANPAKIV